MHLECEDCAYSSPVGDLAELESECPECGAVLVLVAEEGSSDRHPTLDGISSDLPPLPSWDGSDTQEVRGLAAGRLQPGLAVPLRFGDELSDAAEHDSGRVGAVSGLDELVETVHITTGTGGGGSRTYDSDVLSRQLQDPSQAEAPSTEPLRRHLGEDTRNWDVADLPLEPSNESPPKESETRAWKELRRTDEPETQGWSEIQDSGSTKPSPQSWDDLRSDEPETLSDSRSWGDDLEPDTSGWEGRLFPIDPDWEALIDEGLKEMEEDDPHAKRRVIKVPSSLAPRGDEDMTAAQLDELLSPYGVQAPPDLTGEVDSPTDRWSLEREDFRIEAEAPPPQAEIAQVVPHQLDRALVVIRRTDSAEARRYSDLISRLGGAPLTYLVTSTRRREGRTTVALNLALATTRQPGRSAIYVEADLDGRGALAAFGIPPADEGLLSTLDNHTDPRRAFVRFNLGNFDLVPRGHGGRRELVTSGLGVYLEVLRDLYPEALIVVDAPPVEEGAARLCAGTDGVILVVRRGRSPRAQVSAAVATLGRGKLVGTVFNEG